MGGAVSAGHNNGELVDNLCYEDYIRTPEVERVFRQVDRADFMTFPDDTDMLEAYEDHAWRRGTLHLSAPCIYTRAMEALQFKRGVSFLNVGSGTGYLSTMAGLLIGPYGINHGVEIYPENIEFAQQKQTEFYEKFPWYDPVNYCEPFFVVGNGLLLSPGNLLYDRIYCGAGCPPEHAQLMKNMLSVGGILVMPHDNQLESIHRVNLTEWKTDVILPSVSFAPLILPSQESVKDLIALEIAVQPLTLKQCCRLDILQQLGREKYDRISELPLPQHLKDYVAHYREWDTPSPPVKILCPIDHSIDNKEHSGSEDSQSKNEEGQSGAEEQAGHVFNGWRRSRARPSGVRRPNAPYAQPMNVNGRRMLICNVNGVYFQIPMDSDDNPSESDEDNQEKMEENNVNEEDKPSDDDTLAQDSYNPGANDVQGQVGNMQDSEISNNTDMASQGEYSEDGSELEESELCDDRDDKMDSNYNESAASEH